MHPVEGDDGENAKHDDDDSRKAFRPGGAGVWNALANRPSFFAAAVITCGGESSDDGTGSAATPLWDFHGDSDEVVPVL
jgi:predicted peptidase